MISDSVAELDGTKEQDNQHEKSTAGCDDQSVQPVLVGEPGTEAVGRQPDKAAQAVLVMTSVISEAPMAKMY